MSASSAKRVHETAAGPSNQMGPKPLGKLASFWDRVTEGLALEQLWSNFKSEARAGYQLYSRELPSRAEGTTPGRSKWETAKALFWAVLMKLSPARRVVLVLALVLLLFPNVRFRWGDATADFTGFFDFWSAVLLLLVLALEIADRVTMKRDLEIAREIQTWLVPEVPPSIPRLKLAFVTRPANTVAGDYYDVLRRDGSGRVLLTVADVAGKSIPAALLMATYQASLRTLAATECALPELVAGINRYSCAHSQGGRRFTTAFIGELDTGTGELAYINAGHNAPVLRRRNGAIERLESGTLPLGIESDTAFPAHVKILSEGDVLLVFTDGLVEAVNDLGEEYGEERMLAVLAMDGDADQRLKRLMADVERFVGTASRHDDITCLLAQVTG